MAVPQAVGVNGDTAGGAVTATATHMTIGGKPVLRFGDAVARHGDDAHAAATMAGFTTKLTVERKGVCLNTHAATCGHTLAATLGAGKVTVGL